MKEIKYAFQRESDSWRFEEKSVMNLIIMPSKHASIVLVGSRTQIYHGSEAPPQSGKMIRCGKTIKLLKWILHRHHEEQKGTGKNITTGELVSNAQHVSQSCTQYEASEDIDETNGDEGRTCTDGRLIVGKTQQIRSALGIGSLELNDRIMQSSAEPFSLRKLRNMGFFNACLMPFKPNLHIRRPYTQKKEYISLIEGHDEQIRALEDIRRRASIMGSQKLLTLKDHSPKIADTSKKDSREDETKILIDTAETQKRSRTSRMKEIMKWQANSKNSPQKNRWKIICRNKGSLGRTPGSDEDLMSCSRKLIKWDRRNYSSSSFSSSGSSSSSSRGVQSKWDLQGHSLIAAPKCSRDNWITTDSEWLCVDDSSYFLSWTTWGQNANITNFSILNKTSLHERSTTTSYP
eukprot:Gb_38745 [translate_table: standard]